MAKKSFDEQLRSISAFKGWKDLVISCKYHGYVPTLRYGLHSTGDEKDAIHAVRRFLTRCGYRVYPRWTYYTNEN